MFLLRRELTPSLFCIYRLCSSIAAKLLEPPVKEFRFEIWRVDSLAGYVLAISFLDYLYVVVSPSCCYMRIYRFMMSLRPPLC